MSVCAVSGASGCKEGKRRSGSELAAQQRTAEQQTVSSHTHTQAWHAIRSQCGTLCMPSISGYICVCTSWPARLLFKLFSCTPDFKILQVWIICLALAESSRIREGMESFFFFGMGGGEGGLMKKDSI